VEDQRIDERLSRCILKELQLPTFTLLQSTRAFEVPGWDSLAHAGIIVAIEDEFGIRFKTRDVIAMESVGDLERLVREATAG
jgi:acyl carrier protein